MNANRLIELYAEGMSNLHFRGDVKLNTPEAILGFDWDDVPVKVSIYPSAAERSPRRGQERARLAQVEALVAAAESTIAPHPSVP